MLIKSVLIALCAASAVLAGCTPQVPKAMAAVNDKVYTVTPETMQVKAGIVTGELSLRNTSSDQTVRLVGGKISYIDSQGKPIAMEDNRSAPAIQVGSTGYSSSDRLDPGQSSSHTLDAEFPVAALKGGQ